MLRHERQTLSDFLWILGLVFLLLIVVTTTGVAASSTDSTSWTASVGDQYTETVESNRFHTGYQLHYTYQSDGQWHPDTIIVWTPRIQQENPHTKYIEATYNAGNNVENYRKIAEWTQKVRDADTSATATLSNNLRLLHEAIIPGVFVDGPVNAVMKIFGIIEKTKAEINVHNDYTRQYIDNIYGSAMMMEDLRTE
ncbi:hypothetical protein [Methanorbis rubei]|uniref:Uncharacterized protein n=1 Tax=Methanorbis rubei TaxID=3028300 RepID=A0AAE4MJ78_9EURY|nr:hypothetical protein [Methanocorpusculaceae archaeon Cs1]